MVVNKIINNLVDLGLTEYEAKAYTSLLGAYPSTAYEIAKTSGIPTSKIYEVMSRLTEKGLTVFLNDSEKNKYVPIKPEEFIESKKNKLESTLNEVKEDLLNISKQSDISYIWNIHDYDYLINKTKRIIQDSNESILISTWPDELTYFSVILKKKQKAGIKVSIVHFGEIKTNQGLLFQHPIEDTIYSEKGGRGFVIVADSKEALMSTVFKNNIVEGAWSMNKGFVTLAEDYIKHDIYIMKIVKRFNKQLIKKFGTNYRKLRDVFSDDEEK